jgi:hypothetical protein
LKFDEWWFLKGQEQGIWSVVIYTACVGH